MGRRNGNALEQRKQRTHQRAQREHERVAAVLKAEAKAQAESEAKAKALQILELQKSEARKARMIAEYQNGVGIPFRSQKEWGGEIIGDQSYFPFIWVEYHSYPNGSCYWQAKSLLEGISVANCYRNGGVDLGIHFFNRDLVQVLIST